MINRTRNISYRADINAINYSHAVYSFLALDVKDTWELEEKREFSLLLQKILFKMNTYDSNGRRIPWKERAKVCKLLKKISLKIIRIYGLNSHTEDKIMICLNKDLTDNPFKDDFVGILKLTKRLPSKSKDMIVPSLCRLWEYYYLSHDELKARKKDLHLRMDPYNEESINMRDLKESVYKDPDKFDSFDHFKNLDTYEGDINAYLRKEGINIPFDKKEYTQTLLEFKNLLKEFSNQGIETDSDQRLPFRELFPFVRFHELSGEFNKILNDARSGVLYQNSVKTKDSGSVYNECENFKEYFATRYGISNISNIEGNWITGESDILNIEAIRKHNNIVEHVKGYNIDHLNIDLGLGDCFKERVVGQPATMFQASLAPLTKKYKKEVLDPIKDSKGNEIERCMSIATYDIEKRIEEMQYCPHAISFDYTGFSDYMSRAFLYLMLRILGITEENAKFIITIFSMPLKVNGKMYPILFGTLQGVEFNFSCITLANLLFTVQAIILYKMRYGYYPKDLSVYVQGDDKLIVSRRGKVPKLIKDYSVIYAVAANCVINPSKTEDSEETGSYIFCKIRKRVDGSAISGLSGNLMLKEKKFVGDISAMISQLRKVGYKLNEYEELHIINYLLPRVRNNIYQSYRSLNHLNDEESETLLSLALKLPVEVGGLDVSSLDTEEYILLCKNALTTCLTESFTYNKKITNRIDRFALISGLAKVNDYRLEYLDVRLQELIESTYSKGKEVLELLAKADQLLNSEYIKASDFKDFKKEIRKIFNVLFKEMSNTNAISTKDRVDPIRNQDLILVKSLGDDIKESELESVNNLLTSEEKLYKEVRRLILSDNNLYSDSDLPIYMDITKILKSYNSHFKPCRYNGVKKRYYNGIVFVDGELDGKVLRLDSNNDDYKGNEVNFLTPGDFRSEKHYYMIKNFLRKKFEEGSLDTYLRSYNSKIRIIEEKIIKDIKRDILNSVLGKDK